MIIIYFLSLVVSTVGAVLIPWLVPLLGFAVFRLLEAGVHEFVILFVYATVAASTTAGMWYLDDMFHKWFAHRKKNDQSKHGISWKARRWFDRTFSVTHNRWVIFFAVFAASGSMIPDIFLVEFARIKLPFSYFVIAIVLGKFLSGLVLLYGFDALLGLF